LVSQAGVATEGYSVPFRDPHAPPSTVTTSNVDVEGTINSIVERLSDLMSVQRVIFQGNQDRWGTCFISVGLVGASDDVVKRVQDAWLDRIQASATSTTSIKRKITNRISRGANKVESSVITSEMMRKIDLGVFGFPSLSDRDGYGDGSDESGEGSSRVMLYLNELYGYLEKELADRIKRVRDNNRLWVVTGIRNS
jgi:hypothetical protein